MCVCVLEVMFLFLYMADFGGILYFMVVMCDSPDKVASKFLQVNNLAGEDRRIRFIMLTCSHFRLVCFNSTHNCLIFFPSSIMTSINYRRYVCIYMKKNLFLVGVKLSPYPFFPIGTIFIV